MQGANWFEMPVANNQEEQLYLPPGFRFHPTDAEIIDKYLFRKVANPRFTSIAMGDVDLNKCEPWELPSKAKMGGEKEWYFFAQKDMKYPTGTRINRATKIGYWKATGKDKEIFSIRIFENIKKNVLVGMKKTLVFYAGRAPNGDKTNWVMHEFRLEGKSTNTAASKMIVRDDQWVVCRVYEKKNPKTNRRDEPTPTETDLSNSYDDQEIMTLLADPTNYNSSDMPGSSVTTSVEASSATTMPNYLDFTAMTGWTTQSNQVLLPNDFPSSSQVRINQPWIDNHGYGNLGPIQGQGMANSVVAPMNNFQSYQ